MPSRVTTEGRLGEGTGGEKARRYRRHVKRANERCKNGKRFLASADGSEGTLHVVHQRHASYRGTRGGIGRRSRKGSGGDNHKRLSWGGEKRGKSPSLKILKYKQARDFDAGEPAQGGESPAGWGEKRKPTGRVKTTQENIKKGIKV